VRENHKLNFKHVHAFSFLNLNTPFILLDKEKVHPYIFMVDHRSTSPPECGPPEYPAPEPCYCDYCCGFSNLVTVIIAVVSADTIFVNDESLTARGANKYKQLLFLEVLSNKYKEVIFLVL